MQVRVPRMVFPAPSETPKAMDVRVEGNQTFLANFVRRPVLGNQFGKLASTQQLRLPNQGTPIAATMVPTGGATTSSVRRRVARAWAGRWRSCTSKGDCAEHCGTLGFSNWTSGLRSCLFCTAATDSWFTTDGLDSQRFPFHGTACATCEIVVLVDSATTLASCRCSLTTTGQAVATGGAFWKTSLS